MLWAFLINILSRRGHWIIAWILVASLIGSQENNIKKAKKIIQEKEKPDKEKQDKEKQDKEKQDKEKQDKKAAFLKLFDNDTRS